MMTIPIVNNGCCESNSKHIFISIRNEGEYVAPISEEIGKETF